MNRYIANPTAFRKVLVAALLALTGSLAVTTAGAADAPASPATPAAPANKVQSIDVQPMVGKGAQLIITTSGPAPEPLTFTIDNPARISIDLPDTALALAQRRIDVRQGGLDSVLAAEGNGRSRLVLNLDRMVPYQTKVEGNRILVTLGQAAVAAEPPASAAARTAAAASATHRGIQSIDFRRGNDGTVA
jgi:type IV pilus assembly protein PilQ